MVVQPRVRRAGREGNVQQIIAFVSDFGLDDAWVGVCHAVIYRACPLGQVVDLSHQVPPFDLRKGAAVACAGVHQLPDAIHLVVVDPGVGGGRRDLCIVTRSGCRLIGPDNGVLRPAAELKGGIETVISIAPEKVGSGEPLPTFHARDVLAPAAAALACGVEPQGLGVEVDPETLVAGPFELAWKNGGSVSAEIIDADRFGSLRLSVPADRMKELGLDAPRLEIALGHHVFHVPVGATFSDVAKGEPVALIDSSGWLTIAVNTDSAAERYGVQPGTTAHLRAID
jgi:S-adenosylmethionine hydrolase